MAGLYTLDPSLIIRLTVVVNLVGAALMVAAIAWQYGKSNLRAGITGITIGTVLVVGQRVAGSYVIDMHWSTVRTAVSAGAVAAVVGASIAAALIWTSPTVVEVVIPWTAGSEDDDDDGDSAEPSPLARILPWREYSDSTEGRIPIGDLSSDEIQEAIGYLESVDREPTSDEIERAAYQLADTDTEVQLPSAFETGAERGRVDRSVLAPEDITEKQKWHTRNNDYYQILTATSMPRFLAPGWLLPFTLSNDDVRLSMHVNPRESDDVKGRLQKRLTQMQSAIQRKRQRGRTDVHQDEHEKEELDRLLKQLVRGTTKIYDVSLFFEVRGNTKKEMESASNRLQRKARGKGLDLTPIEGEQDRAQGVVAPIGSNEMENSNAVQLEALTQCFNMVEPPIFDEGGIMIGFDNTKRPIVVDRFSLSGHSKAVSGKVGSGKTYSVKMSMYRRRLVDNDIRIIIFDPLGDDFVDFVRKQDGTVIQFGGGYRVNPLEITPAAADTDTNDSPFKVKMRNVIRLFRTFLNEKDGISAAEEGVFSNAIYYAYLSKGITPDPETFDRESPVINDVIEGIRVIAEGGLDQEGLADVLPEDCPAIEYTPDEGVTMSAAGDGESTQQGVYEAVSRLENPPQRYQEVAEHLLPKMESFKHGNINANLNGQSNIDLDSDLVVFDMSEFADTGQMPLIMHAMLNWAYDEARQSEQKMEVAFEEAHYLMHREGARNLINLFMRHARHFTSGLTLISQTAEEFLKNDKVREMYDNCDIKQLFYQENVSEEVVNYFGLSQSEVRDIQHAATGENNKYSECLYSTTAHGRRWVEIYSGEHEHHMLNDDLNAWEYLLEKGLLTQNDRAWIERQLETREDTTHLYAPVNAIMNAQPVQEDPVEASRGEDISTTLADGGQQ